MSDGPSLDLSIAFHPELSGSVGWAMLPERMGLHMVGQPGAAIVDAVPRWKGDATRLQFFALELARNKLDNTAIVVDEASLCSAELLAAARAARPARMLLSIHNGLTAKAAGCLAALPADNLYITGCLYREYQAESTCDGDAELHELLSVKALAPRIRGLAVSLSKASSVAALGKLPELTYLAVVNGRDAEVAAQFGLLPFDDMNNLRFLDASNWDGWVEVGAPDALRFIGRLHTLSWQGRLLGSLPNNCALRRFSDGRLDEGDIKALADCRHLLELSSDGASFEQAGSVARWRTLRHVHLRHWQASDLKPLAKLTELRTLSLNAAGADNFSFVASLLKLREVSLSQTSLSSLAPFRKLVSLESLDASFTKVGDLEPLRQLAELTELGLHDTQVVNLEPIAKLSSLTKLSISKTGVTDLSSLKHHPSLEWIILYDSAVTDISPLLTLPKLNRLNIAGLTLPPKQVAKLRKRPGFRIDD